MLSKRILILLILIAGFAAVRYFFYFQPQQTGQQETKKLGVTNSNKSPHPVSLPALMEKKFDGHDLVLGQVLAENEAYTRYYITYQSQTLKISGIMNVPKGAGPFPLLVLNHGHIDTAVYTNGRGLKREQDFLARRGYVVLHPDYRNHADSDKDQDNEVNFRLGYSEDVINAVLAVKASDLSFVDKNKVGMLGHSMGGGVTLNVLVAKPELVQAAVLFAPVSADVRDNFERWIKRRPETAEKILQSYGQPEKNPEFWENISPLNFLANIAVPIQTHHGTADESVPLEWSEKLHRALLADNKQSQLYAYQGQPHEFTTDWTEVMEKTVKFFNNSLGNEN